MFAEAAVEDPALRGAGQRLFPISTVVVMTPAFRNAFTSARTFLSETRNRSRFITGTWVDRVETRRDVGYENPRVTTRGRRGTGSRRPRPGHAGSGGTHTTRGLEIDLEDWFQHQLQNGLHHPVSDSRDGGFILPPEQGVFGFPRVLR